MAKIRVSLNADGSATFRQWQADRRSWKQLRWTIDDVGNRPAFRKKLEIEIVKQEDGPEYPLQDSAGKEEID